MKQKRRNLLIDRPVQLGLVVRIFFHWVMFLAIAIVALPVFRTIILVDLSTSMSERARQAGADAVVLIVLFTLLLPYFIYNTFQITNRFAGPMYRLHRFICNVGIDENLEPISFRKGDYWHDVAKDFNKMVERLKNNSDGGEEAEPVEQEETAAV